MTGLWLKGLPPLEPTNIVEPEWLITPSGKRMSKTHWNTPHNGHARSVTYQGIADAMAEQWGGEYNRSATRKIKQLELF